MKFIIIQKYSESSTDWYMTQNTELPTEKQADQLKDALQEINPSRVYRVISLLEQENLEVVKNDVQLWYRRNNRKGRKKQPNI